MPGKYADDGSGNATWVVPEAMNNMNAEEPSRYVDVATCDYIVDQDRGPMRCVGCFFFAMRMNAFV